MTKALTAVGCLALCAGAALGGGGTITNGDASLQLIGPTVWSSNLPDANMRCDGASSPDQLAKFTWYYRQQNNNQNHFMSFIDTPAESYVGDTSTITYTNAGTGVAGFERFDARIVTKIIDGAVPNQVRVTSDCVFTSRATTVRTYQVFVLCDIDLAGGVPNPGPDDRISFDPSTFTATQTETSSTNFAKIAALAPTKWQVGSASTLRNSTLAGGSFDLSNAVGPFSGDSGAAFQWTLTLNPGETRTLSMAYTINADPFPPSCPCVADFDASGGTPDVGDIDAFFMAWLAGDPTADADCSGGTPDVNDIDVFFVQWLAGGC